MGEALEIAKVLVAPTMKLLDMVGGAIGTAYEPRHKRKMTDATVYEINAIGEAMRNAADLPVVYNQDGVAINSEDFTRLMQRAGTRLALQETIKQHNIESVVDNAYEILEKEDVCSEEPVEKGWINRFFDSVSDVSDADLQQIWGKVLAGEIKQPKSYSLRTLETLKNLSKSEAELFQKIFPCVVTTVKNSFLISNTEILRKYDIIYDDILRLNECGLVNSSTDVSLNLPLQSNQTVALHNRSKLILVHNLGLKETIISFGAFGLTKAGEELFCVLENNPNDEYLCEFAHEIAKNNSPKVKVTVHQITHVEADGIRYDNEALTEFPARNDKTA